MSSAQTEFIFPTPLPELTEDELTSKRNQHIISDKNENSGSGVITFFKRFIDKNRQRNPILETNAETNKQPNSEELSVDGEVLKYISQENRLLYSHILRKWDDYFGLQVTINGTSYQSRGAHKYLKLDEENPRALPEKVLRDSVITIKDPSAFAQAMESAVSSFVLGFGKHHPNSWVDKTDVNKLWVNASPDDLNAPALFLEKVEYQNNDTTFDDLQDPLLLGILRGKSDEISQNLLLRDYIPLAQYEAPHELQFAVSDSEVFNEFENLPAIRYGVIGEGVVCIYAIQDSTINSLTENYINKKIEKINEAGVSIKDFFQKINDIPEGSEFLEIIVGEPLNTILQNKDISPNEFTSILFKKISDNTLKEGYFDADKPSSPNIWDFVRSKLSTAQFKSAYIDLKKKSILTEEEKNRLEGLQFLSTSLFGLHYYLEEDVRSCVNGINMMDEFEENLLLFKKRYESRQKYNKEMRISKASRTAAYEKHNVSKNDDDGKREALEFENLHLDANPSGVIALTGALAAFKKRGITEIQVPTYLPARQHVENPDLDTSILEKTIKIIERTLAEVKGVELVNPGTDGFTLYLRFTGEELTSDREILQQIIDLIRSKV